MPQRAQMRKSAVSVPNAYRDTRAGSWMLTSTAPRGFEVHTPPCFWQKVQSQARAGISFGSGSQVRVNEMFPQWHLPRISIGHAVGFNFHQPALVDQALHFDEGARRLDRTEHLAVRARRFLPARDVGEHHARADHAVEPETRVADRLRDDLQAALGLAIHVAG